MSYNPVSHHEGWRDTGNTIRENGLPRSKNQTTEAQHGEEGKFPLTSIQSILSSGLERAPQGSKYLQHRILAYASQGGRIEVFPPLRFGL